MWRKYSGTILAVNDKLIFCGKKAELRCHNANTGNTKWRYSLPNCNVAKLVIGEKNVYFTTVGIGIAPQAQYILSRLYVLKKETGELQWIFYPNFHKQEKIENFKSVGLVAWKYSNCREKDIHCRFSHVLISFSQNILPTLNRKKFRKIYTENIHRGVYAYIDFSADPCESSPQIKLVNSRGFKHHTKKFTFFPQSSFFYQSSI